MCSVAVHSSTRILHTGQCTHACFSERRSRSAPSSSHKIRSATSSTRGSCVTRTIAQLLSRAISWRIMVTSCPLWESRFPVGSSASINGGLLIKARAMATLCFSPPDRVAGSACLRPERFNRLISSFARPGSTSMGKECSLRR